AKGVIRNWLAVQDEKGFVDWKPGLAGQRNRALCIPLLTTMAWQLYEFTDDRDFLAEVYPGLRRFVEVWFTRRHDRDGDGVPEWSHTIQSAFDDCPSFARTQPWAQGADTTQAEAPDLAAYLFRECLTLSRIAALLSLPEEPALREHVETLKRAVEAMWRDETASYHYVDRDSHEVTRGEVLATGRGNLLVESHRRFSPSARILVKAIGPRDARPEMEITLVGRGRRGRGRVETLRRASQIQWYFGVGTGVSEKLYAELDRVEVSGLTDEFEVTVSVVDTSRQDQTLLLPLWAGMPDAVRARKLIRQTILDPARYWRPYGIPNCSALDPAYQPDNRGGSGGVWLMWNTMIGEGLVEYGYRAEAAELITR
ncbi:MAG: MGH1-like glycoside hydrolase domain-containing protein, partial [Anaerolineales bacterium]